jgi:hypothetical protein
MSVDQWWPKLQSSTQQWLMDHNGDVIPYAILSEITEAGGPAAGDSWWGDSKEAEGLIFPDEAIDWVEEAANDENPA